MVLVVRTSSCVWEEEPIGQGEPWERPEGLLRPCWTGSLLTCHTGVRPAAAPTEHPPHYAVLRSTFLVTETLELYVLQYWLNPVRGARAVITPECILRASGVIPQDGLLWPQMDRPSLLHWHMRELWGFFDL